MDDHKDATGDIHAQNQVRTNPGITYGTQGQLDNPDGCSSAS
jgi:hypothetical protein